MLEPRSPFHLDRARLRAAFERASGGYEAAASLQARVAAELLERLELLRFSPGAVLDLGSIDLIFSNLMLQWCEPLAAALSEARRVLAPGGFLSFSTFGPATLYELRTAWAEADGYNHVNHFPDMHEVGDGLVRAGLMEPVLDADRFELGYPDVLTLMRDLKAIGAHNVTAGRPRALAGRERLTRVQRAYEAFRRDEGLPATYEVIYGASWGAAGRPASAQVEGLVRIAPGSIRRNRP